jgi:predicted metal-dependent phosphoesterase TrpH
VLLVLGALAGTVAQWGLPSRVPPRAGEFLVLSGDFHVHGFPGDGALPLWALRNEARRRGLDVIALTNHNQRLAGRMGRWLTGDSTTPLVLRAEELTTRYYHIAAVGVEDEIDDSLSAAAAIAAIHAQGGVAIAAHPVREFWIGYDTAARAALDGAEIAVPGTAKDPKRRGEIEEFTRSAREVNADLAPIGSTDYHFRRPMGLCRTYIFAREYSEAGVLEAIRAGRTVAFDAEGRAYGDAALVTIASRASADAPAAPAWRAVLDRLSGFAAMAGLFGLITTLFSCRGSADRARP